MKFMILLTILFSSCSLTEIEKKFIDNIQGTYLDSTKEEFIIDTKNGDFLYNNTRYTMVKIISETNATYLLDDTQYAGIVYHPKNKKLEKELKYIFSTNLTETGIDFKASGITLGIKDAKK